MIYQDVLEYLYNSLPMYQRIGKAAYKEDITNTVKLMAGEFSSTAWGCDLTYDYVKINGDYRT